MVLCVLPIRGRCLLSGYINRRDPNQGTCTNACRWKYQAHAAKENHEGDVVPIHVNPVGTAPEPTLGKGETSDEMVLLQEQGRPDQYMPAFEDEHGTYIMNSKDLRAIQHVHRLSEMGIHSLKIEGRTKSFYYVARTAQVYRQTIDAAAAGLPFDKGMMDTLENLASRGYTEGFYRRHVHDEYQNYNSGNSSGTKQQFVGEVIDCNGRHMTIDVKNRFEKGDVMELMTPQGNKVFTLDHLENRQGESVTAAPGSGHIVQVPIPEGITPDTYSLLVRNLP